MATNAVPAKPFIIQDLAYKNPVASGIFKSSVKATPISGNEPTNKISFVSKVSIWLLPVTPI